MTGAGNADPALVVQRFNEAVNHRDVDGLAGLMPDDHAFTDSEGGVVSGKRGCLDVWHGFFEAFPDYRNVFGSLTVRGDLVTAVGYSVCSEPRLAGPAIWTARVRGGQVVEWRVYADTPAVRGQLALPDGE